MASLVKESGKWMFSASSNAEMVFSRILQQDDKRSGVCNIFIKTWNERGEFSWNWRGSNTPPQISLHLMQILSLLLQQECFRMLQLTISSRWSSRFNQYFSGRQGKVMIWLTWQISSGCEILDPFACSTRIRYARRTLSICSEAMQQLTLVILLCKFKSDSFLQKKEKQNASEKKIRPCFIYFSISNYG